MRMNIFPRPEYAVLAILLANFAVDLQIPNVQSAQQGNIFKMEAALPPAKAPNMQIPRIHYV